jgi:lysophospholipase L1-like esterase
VAAALAVAALVISPLGIELITGRADLSFRVNVISLTFVVFLVAVIAALLAQGRLRRACFYAVAWTFPFAALAGMEGMAVLVQLADRVAPLEDTSLLANKAPWPTHLLSDSSYYTTPEGFVLYRPWHGGGITFNTLGLRTAMPTLKAPGEWRVAVTGGSAAWGWRVVDADTIPVRLQEILRREGHNNVTVYNFGIGGATLKQELALLKHFRDSYSIDQVLFYTGGNDVFGAYLDAVNKRSGPWAGSAATFELIKVAARLQAIWSEPSAPVLQWLDNEALPAALKIDMLPQAIAEADDYCRASKLRCDFVLQPMLYERRSHTGAEARIMQTLLRVYPRIDALTARMFGDAMKFGPADRMHDFAHIFDWTEQPFFLDFIHLNEAGNRIAAERIAPIVAPGLP